jgi:hypothetical protein
VPPAVKYTVSSSSTSSPVRVTVNVAGSVPTSDACASVATMVTFVRSSLTIVAVADDGDATRYAGSAATVSVTVSSRSTSVSSTGTTVTDAVELPAGIVTVPLSAV